MHSSNFGCTHVAPYASNRVRIFRRALALSPTRFFIVVNHINDLDRVNDAN
jgi:hypothetical protein